jgi:DNA modification methylase
MENENKQPVLFKYRTVPVKNLTIEKGHPRRMHLIEYDKLKRIIEEYGIPAPVIINHDMTVIDGVQRTRACRDLKIDNIPCIEVNLSKEKATILGLALNRISGTWDEKNLQAILERLAQFTDIDLTLTGFDMPEIEEILALDVKKGLTDADAIPEPPQDPRTRPGDLYELGPHRLLCGDATNPDDISHLMSHDVAKLIFTSPPYNMAGGMYKEYSDNMKSTEYIDFNLRVVTAWQRYLKGYLFWNISYNKNSRWEFIEIMYRIVKETGLTFLELILWDKGHGLPIVTSDALTRQYEDILLTGDEESIHQELELFCISTTSKRAWFNKRTGKGVTNCWHINTSTEKVQLGNHLACFPVALPSRAIRLMSNINDIVCDPFGGSGSTLIACEQLFRRCRLMELSPAYCDVIVERYVGYIGVEEIVLNNSKIIW